MDLLLNLIVWCLRVCVYVLLCVVDCSGSCELLVVLVVCFADQAECARGKTFRRIRENTLWCFTVTLDP